MLTIVGVFSLCLTVADSVIHVNTYFIVIYLKKVMG